MSTLPASPWSAQEFETRLRGKGAGYHIYHPFHVAMAQGQLTREQLQGWVANRFYYQISIPRKDAAILTNCDDREVRREWVLRIPDHDGYGYGDDDGGIDARIELGLAVGLSRDDVVSLRLVAPAARFAVDAYVEIARRASWQEAVASSLTERFAPHIHRQRLDTWPEQCPWVDAADLRYFKNRLTQARRDVQHGLTLTLVFRPHARIAGACAGDPAVQARSAVGAGRRHRAQPVRDEDRGTQSMSSAITAEQVYAVARG